MRTETTLTTALETYLKALVDRSCSDRHVTTVRWRMTKYIDWQGDRPVADILGRDIDRYFRDLQESGLAVGTLAGHKSTMKAFWRFCWKRKWVERNPARILSKGEHAYSFRPVHSRAANPAHFEKVIEVLAEFAGSGRLRDIRDAALVSLVIDSAARRGELHNLRRADMATALRHNEISPDGLSIYHAYSTGKTGRADIRFYQESADLLQLWINIMPTGAAWLWCSLRDGQRLRIDYMDSSLKRICEYAQVPVFRFHAIRKRAVTDIIAATGDPKMGQMLAGHSDSRMTLDYYNDIRAVYVDQVAAQLSARRRHGEDYPLDMAGAGLNVTDLNAI